MIAFISFFFVLTFARNTMVWIFSVDFFSWFVFRFIERLIVSMLWAIFDNFNWFTVWKPIFIFVSPFKSRSNSRISGNRTITNCTFLSFWEIEIFLFSYNIFRIFLVLQLFDCFKNSSINDCSWYTRIFEFI